MTYISTIKPENHLKYINNISYKSIQNEDNNKIKIRTVPPSCPTRWSPPFSESYAVLYYLVLSYTHRKLDKII